MGPNLALSVLVRTYNFRRHFWPYFACRTALSGLISTRMAMSTDTNITRVLFCGQYFPAGHRFTKEHLQKYPFMQVDQVPQADFSKVIENYHLCLVRNVQLDSNIISRAKQMKLIMQYGVGLEGVDIDAATNCGIKVARIPSIMCRNGYIPNVGASSEAE